MRLLDVFDRIRIVNLPERTDRRHEMDHELVRVGLAGDTRIAYYPAIRPDHAATFTSIGARGVYLSQCDILREAAMAGESLLILEDDCSFTAKARDFPDPAGWDIFYGGYYASDPNNIEDSDIMGAHMMGFSAQGVRRVSAYLEALSPTTAIHPPIDAAYVWYRRAHPATSVAFAKPPLAFQRSSPSDIAAVKFHHRLPLGRKMGALTRALLNRLR